MKFRRAEVVGSRAEAAMVRLGKGAACPLPHGRGSERRRSMAVAVRIKTPLADTRLGSGGRRFGRGCWGRTPSIHLMRGQEHGLAQGFEELLVGAWIFDGLEVELGVGADEDLRLAVGAHGDGHAKLVAVELGGADRADHIVGAIDDETEVLKRGHDRSKRGDAVGGVENAGLDAAEFDGAGVDLQELTPG